MFCATVFDCINRYNASEELDLKTFRSDLKEKMSGSNIVIKCTVKQPEKNPFVELVLSCSFYKNSEKLFRTDNGGKFSCLNGLRAISMVWIIIAHTFKYLAEYEYFFLLSKNELSIAFIQNNS